jgi:hypothetical protein
MDVDDGWIVGSRWIVDNGCMDGCERWMDGWWVIDGWWIIDGWMSTMDGWWVIDRLWIVDGCER